MPIAYCSLFVAIGDRVPRTPCTCTSRWTPLRVYYRAWPERKHFCFSQQILDDQHRLPLEARLAVKHCQDPSLGWSVQVQGGRSSLLDLPSRHLQTIGSRVPKSQVSCQLDTHKAACMDPPLNSLGLTSPHLRRSMPYQTPADYIAPTDTEVHRCLSFVSASPPALLALLSRLAGRSQSRGGLGREDEKLKVETFITKIVSEILGNSSSPLRINIDKFGKRVGNVNIGKNKVYCGPIHLMFKAI